MLRSSSSPPPANPERAWTRGSGLALLASALLILTSLISLVYRVDLPGDGWIFREETTDDISITIAEEDVMRFPSGLRVDDQILLAAGVDLGENSATFQPAPLPPGWRPGETVTYQVLRAGESLDVPVTVGYWSPARLAGRLLANPLDFLTNLFLLALGSYVFFKRPGSPAARVMLWLSAIGFSMSVGADILPLNTGDYFDRFGFYSAAFFGFLIWGIALFPTITLFTFVFPRPKHFFTRYPWPVLVFLYGTTLVLFLLTDWAWQAGWGMVVVFALLALISVIHSFLVSRKDPVARAQVGWVALGLGILVGWRIIGNLTVFWLASGSDQGFLKNVPLNLIDLLDTLVSLAFPICLAVAILRYRLFDIEVIIRRTLLYGALTLILSLVYFGFILVTQQLFRGVTGQDSPVAVVLSTLLIAALFTPLRSKLQSAIDRRFFRQRYDAERILAGFRSRSLSVVSLDDLSQEMHAAIQQTIQPETIEIWIRKSGK